MSECCGVSYCDMTNSWHWHVRMLWCVMLWHVEHLSTCKQLTKTLGSKRPAVDWLIVVYYSSVNFATINTTTSLYSIMLWHDKQITQSCHFISLQRSAIFSSISEQHTMVNENSIAGSLNQRSLLILYRLLLKICHQWIRHQCKYDPPQHKCQVATCTNTISRLQRDESTTWYCRGS